MIPPPKNFVYNQSLDRLEWDSVEGASEYQIEYKDDPLSTWKHLYTGSNSYCPFGLGSGTYSIKGRTKDRESGEWGVYGDPETVVVT